MSRTCAWCSEPLKRTQERYCSTACYWQAKVGTVGPNAGRSFPAKSHCPAGHPYTEANTLYYMARGVRLKRCKTCRSEQVNRRRAEARAAVLGG